MTKQTFTHLNQSAKGETEQMAEIKCLNPEYVSCLQGLWANALDLMTHTNNKLGEVYRISQIVRIFASNKAKVDNLREQLAIAEKKKDIYMLKHVAKLAGYCQEEKGFDKMWSTVSHDYDILVRDFIDTTTNENLLMTIPTSEEILEKAQKYYSEAREDAYKLALETARAEIAL